MAASFFAISNILAGVFHYLFQVLASKEMAAAEFAQFSVWLATVAVLCMLGGLLQYAGNFFPSTKSQAERSLLVSTALTFVFSVAWFFIPASNDLQGALIVISAGLFGWILGQIQQRLLFLLMGIMNLAMAGVKVFFVLIPGTFGTVMERFSYALLICYFVALLVTYLVSRSSKFEITSSPSGMKSTQTAALWLAPLLLSISGAIIPQMDIIVLQKWQPDQVFQDFVRASLFYKGIYFLMFIFAQWMLPQQISKTGSKAHQGILTYHFAIAAFVGSLAVTVVAPYVEQFILKWDSMPPAAMIFYSCFNMSLLTWVFLLIQESCARHQLRLAGAALVVIFMNLGAQLLLQLEVVQYFQLSILVYLSLLITMIRVLRLSASKPVSSL